MKDRSSPLTTAAVRSLLERLLRSDADLNAFCLDHFPAVYRRFSSGMDRVEKLNLLLGQEPDLDRIVQRLHERFPDAEARRSEPALPTLGTRSRLPVLFAAVLLIVGLSAWLAVRLRESISGAAALDLARVRGLADAGVPADFAQRPPPAGAPCGSGNLNASCNSIQAEPGSQVIINATQSR